jgi:putative MATE family efflux protein
MKGGGALREQPAALGTEPVGRLLWHACTQTTMSVGVYGVYALSNAWFVSRAVGPIGLASVNVVAPALLALGAVATAVGVAGGSMVSRGLGAADPQRAARAAGNAFTVFWLCSTVVGIGGLLSLNPLLTLLGATEATRGYAHAYGQILLAGAPTATGFSSLVRAEGRMRFSALLWIVPVLTQIGLDPLLIYGLGLGVRGAGLGTVGGQAVSAGMSVWFFFFQRARPYRVTAADLRPHGATLRELLTLGAPTFLSSVSASVLAAVANNLLVAMGGPVTLAAYALCTRIGTFATMPQTGIAQGLQPVAGYNAGLGLGTRVERAIGLALRATLLYGAVICVILLVFAHPLVAVFTSDPALRIRAVSALRLLALTYLFAGVSPLIAACFQAVGRRGPAYLISAGTILLVRIPMLLAFSRFGPSGVLVSFPVAEGTAATLALFILHRYRASAGGLVVLPCQGAHGQPRADQESEGS